MSASVSMEDFEALLNESFELETPDEGSVVKGTVIANTNITAAPKPTAVATFLDTAR